MDWRQEADAPQEISMLLPNSKHKFFGLFMRMEEGQMKGEIYDAVSEESEDTDDRPNIYQSCDVFSNMMLVNIYVKPVGDSAVIMLHFVTLDFLDRIDKSEGTLTGAMLQSNRTSIPFDEFVRSPLNVPQGAEKSISTDLKDIVGMAIALMCEDAIMDDLPHLCQFQGDGDNQPCGVVSFIHCPFVNRFLCAAHADSQPMDFRRDCFTDYEWKEMHVREQPALWSVRRQALTPDHDPLCQFRGPSNHETCGEVACSFDHQTKRSLCKQHGDKNEIDFHPDSFSQEERVEMRLLHLAKLRQGSVSSTSTEVTLCKGATMNSTSSEASMLTIGWPVGVSDHAENLQSARPVHDTTTTPYLQDTDCTSSSDSDTDETPTAHGGKMPLTEQEQLVNDFAAVDVDANAVGADDSVKANKKNSLARTLSLGSGSRSDRIKLKQTQASQQQELYQLSLERMASAQKNFQRNAKSTKEASAAKKKQVKAATEAAQQQQKAIMKQKKIDDAATARTAAVAAKRKKADDAKQAADAEKQNKLVAKQQVKDTATALTLAKKEKTPANKLQSALKLPATTTGITSQMAGMSMQSAPRTRNKRDHWDDDDDYGGHDDSYMDYLANNPNTPAHHPTQRTRRSPGSKAHLSTTSQIQPDPQMVQQFETIQQALTKLQHKMDQQTAAMEIKETIVQPSLNVAVSTTPRTAHAPQTQTLKQQGDQTTPHTIQALQIQALQQQSEQNASMLHQLLLLQQNQKQHRDTPQPQRVVSNLSHQKSTNRSNQETPQQQQPQQQADVSPQWLHSQPAASAARRPPKFPPMHYDDDADAATEVHMLEQMVNKKEAAAALELKRAELMQRLVQHTRPTQAPTLTAVAPCGSTQSDREAILFEVTKRLTEELTVGRGAHTIPPPSQPVTGNPATINALQEITRQNASFLKELSTRLDGLGNSVPAPPHFQPPYYVQQPPQYFPMMMQQQPAPPPRTIVTTITGL